MERMSITSAKYLRNENGENFLIKAVVEDQTYAVPLDPANRHYAEICKQVEAGTLVIQEADD